MFRVAKFEGDLEAELAAPLRHMLQAAPSLLAGGKVSDLLATRPEDARVVGPLPVYSGDPSRMVAARRVGAGLRPAGWRALVTVADHPVAVADFDLAGDGRLKMVRGEEAAMALALALETAQRVATEREWAPQHRQVRIIELPQIYTTAVWVVGNPSLVVPTRLGSAARPPAHGQTARQFLAGVERALHRRQPGLLPAPAAPGAGASR